MVEPSNRNNPRPPSSDVRAKAALSLFRRAGLVVEVLDEHHWRIMSPAALVQEAASEFAYLFWPATGYWKRPDGSAGGGGAVRLIREFHHTRRRR